MRWQTRIKKLYTGRGKQARKFQYGLLGFDIITVGFFVVTSMLPQAGWFVIADYGIAVALSVDFILRFIIADKKIRFVFKPLVIADLIVIATLLLPAFIENFMFMRVLRALRLLRSYHIVKDLKSVLPVFKNHESVINSTINLLVFIFFVTALVYVLQVRSNPQITNYVDALYFTVTTLTTTGFGDVVLTGSTGRLLSVIIMVFGVALFLRLVQTIFRPERIHVRCPDCGLSRHEPDAIHCKHCGRVIHIENDGDVL